MQTLGVLLPFPPPLGFLKGPSERGLGVLIGVHEGGWWGSRLILMGTGCLSTGLKSPT